MTKRLSGSSNSGKQYKRDAEGWYVEPESAVDQLFDALQFRSRLIWDPSCGRGTILDVAKRRGFDTFGSDIVDRYKPGGHRFERCDFRHIRTPTLRVGTSFSIVNNPPYNEPAPMIAETFVEQALYLGGWDRAAFLVPLEFQCGQTRFEKFFRDPSRRPSHVVSLCERPSMPPGRQLEDLGESCRGGGMADYCWLVWTAGGPYRTEHLFARPTNSTAPNSLRRVRSGRNAASA